MGRLALRAGWGDPDLAFVHVKEIEGGIGRGVTPNLQGRGIGNALTQEAIQLARALRIARFFLPTTTAANAKGPDL